MRGSLTALLFGIGAGLGRCTEHGLGDSVLLVQKAAEAASPRTEAQEQLGVAIDVKAKYQVNQLFARLMPDASPSLVGVLGTVMSMSAALIRSTLPDAELQVFEGLMALDLPSRNMNDPEAVGELLGEVAAIFDNAGLKESSGMWLKVQEIVPPLMVAAKKAPAMEKELTATFKRKVPAMLKAMREDYELILKTVAKESLEAGKDVYLDVFHAGQQTTQELFKDLTDGINNLLKEEGLDEKYVRYGLTEELGKLKPLLEKVPVQKVVNAVEGAPDKLMNLKAIRKLSE